MKKNILISTPNYFETLTYLPYVHALLKTFCEKNSIIAENFNWFEPIFLNDTAERLLSGREPEINVLGLSCYLWNWPLQLEIAKRVREKSPNCLIVMGGPHPDWKDTEFFKKYPFIDIVVKNEGELPFQEILLQSLNENPDYSKISSLMLPSEDKSVIHTGGPMRIVDWDKSSVWQIQDMKVLAEKYHEKTRLGVVWETNRGCPYQCSFCDWGSATYSKTRLLPDERLEQDLQFFAQNKITKVFIADANFGMFPRDVDIAQKVVQFKEKFGYPKLIHWSSAKNFAEPLVKIAQVFLDNEMDDSVVVSLQSTNEHTVVEMGRGAHSLKTSLKFSHLIDELGAPKVAQFILGAPGESADEYINSINKMLELNFHRAFYATNFAILPNAPIADAEKMKKYKIQTITRPTNRTWGHRSTLWKWKSGEETIIVGHDKMTHDDWVKMNMYKSHVMCFHHLGLTRYLSRALKNILGLSYADFYNHLFKRAIEDTGFVGSQYKFVQNGFYDYLRNEDGIYALPGIDPDWFIDHESSLFCKLILNEDELKKWIASVVLELCQEKNLDVEFVRSALHFQINTWITPRYNPNKGHSFESDYDFQSYFSQLKDWDRDTIKLEKKNTKYFINVSKRVLKDHIAYFDWNDGQTINPVKYQHRVIIGAYRRYMSVPLFDELQTEHQPTI